jgi:AcrR family transcriptional regulator
MSSTPTHSEATAPGELTRQRLLDSAETLFAERGYNATSVRDITSAAQCNVASVNYHFGGKERLYEEMFRRLLVDMRQQRVRAIRGVMQEEGVGLEEVLRTFSRVFVEPLRDAQRGQRLMHLFMRELTEPCLPEGMLYREIIHPTAEVLGEAMRQVCPGVDDRELLLSMHSLVGQLIHGVQAMRMYGRVEMEVTPVNDVSELIDHVVDFTAAGMRALMQKERM